MALRLLSHLHSHRPCRGNLEGEAALWRRIISLSVFPVFIVLSAMYFRERANFVDALKVRLYSPMTPPYPPNSL